MTPRSTDLPMVEIARVGRPAEAVPARPIIIQRAKLERGRVPKDEQARRFTQSIANQYAAEVGPGFEVTVRAVGHPTASAGSLIGGAR